MTCIYSHLMYQEIISKQFVCVCVQESYKRHHLCFAEKKSKFTTYREKELFFKEIRYMTQLNFMCVYERTRLLTAHAIKLYILLTWEWLLLFFVLLYIIISKLSMVTAEERKNNDALSGCHRRAQISARHWILLFYAWNIYENFILLWRRQIVYHHYAAKFNSLTSKQEINAKKKRIRYMDFSSKNIFPAEIKCQSLQSTCFFLHHFFVCLSLCDGEQRTESAFFRSLTTFFSIAIM